MIVTYFIPIAAMGIDVVTTVHRIFRYTSEVQRYTIIKSVVATAISKLGYPLSPGLEYYISHVHDQYHRVLDITTLTETIVAALYRYLSKLLVPNAQISTIEVTNGGFFIGVEYE